MECKYLVPLSIDGLTESITLEEHPELFTGDKYRKYKCENFEDKTILVEPIKLLTCCKNDNHINCKRFKDADEQLK